MERNKKNIETLAWAVVDYWQQDNIIDYVVHGLKKEYSESKDKFEDDWELFVEDLKDETKGS